MKKITLIILFLMSLSILAQNHTTGIISLSSTMTVRFDTNPTNVTMTLTGPSDRWFAIGIGVSSGFGMGAGDALVYTTSLSDRRFQGFQNPAIDTAQNWTVISNTMVASKRTIVATRILDTGDTAGSDYTFVNSADSFSIAWASSGSASTNVANHGANKGFAMANQVLSNDSFTLAGFKMYPNPAVDLIAIELPSNFQTVNAKIFDMMGKQLLNKELHPLRNKINVSELSKGNYIIILSSGNNQLSTKLIIN